VDRTARSDDPDPAYQSTAQHEQVRTRAESRRAPRENGTVPYSVAFWLTAFGFAVPLAFSAAPTPLYVLYQQRDHYAATTTTVVFAAYAIGVVASLLLVGHVSDWVGRRRVIVPALGMSALSALVFLSWPALPGLLLGRLLTGLGVGALTAPATAALAELNQADGADRRAVADDQSPGDRDSLHRDGRGRASAARSGRRGELVAITANLGGIGLGPLITGLVAQYAPEPLRTPYLVFLFLLVIAMIALSLVPETAPLPDRAPPYRIQRMSVPPKHRGTFFAAAVTSLGSFAVFGLFTSLAPAVLAGLLHHSSHALAGAVAFTPFAAGTALQLVLARARPGLLLVTGGSLVPAGLVLVSAAVISPSLSLFLLGGLVAGAGAGAIFRSAISVVAGLSDDRRRAETLAGIFVAGYIGLTVPIVGLGIATHFASIRISLVAFAIVVIALVVPAAVGLRRRVQ
jgi:MFS family permease